MKGKGNNPWKEGLIAPLANPAPPRSAYIHVPFCRHRCGYCNFTLVAGRDDLIAAYLHALELELAQLKHPRTVDTLFFGGGTPSHLAPPELDRLLKLARRWFPPSETCEISMEVNPNDLNEGRGEVLAAGGVNRISLGVQSFHLNKLRILERDHTPEIAAQAIELAGSFADSVSLDLIFAAPGETPSQWLIDLQTAIGHLTDHLSTYGLTYEQGAPFWSRRARGELVELEEDPQREMYLAARETLSAAGYEHYEISNFSRPGHRCQHNESCWLGYGYYAAGPGACRYVNGLREMNHRSTSTWLKRLQQGESPVAEREELAGKHAARERLVFALRRLEGIEIAPFEEAVGFRLEELVPRAWPELRNLNLLHEHSGSLQLSSTGILLADSVAEKLLQG